MDNAARTRQRVLAIFLPVTAVLSIGGETLSPKGTDQVMSATATALKVLPIAASWLRAHGLISAGVTHVG